MWVQTAQRRQTITRECLTLSCNSESILYEHEFICEGQAQKNGVSEIICCVYTTP